jgi:hypothetical protein
MNTWMNTAVSTLLSGLVMWPGALVAQDTTASATTAIPSEAYYLLDNDDVAVCVPGGLWLGLGPDQAAQIVVAIGLPDDAALADAIADVIEQAMSDAAPLSVIPVTEVLCSCLTGSIISPTTLAPAVVAFAVALAPERRDAIIAGANEVAPDDAVLIEQAAQCAGDSTPGAGETGSSFPGRTTRPISFGPENGGQSSVSPSVR